MLNTLRKGLSLRNFLQTQEEAEPDDLTEGLPAVGETEEEEADDLDALDDDDSLDEDAQTPVTEGPTTEGPAQGAAIVSVPTDELTQLRTDAGLWNANRAQFETLQNWYANVTKGSTLPGTDASDRGQATAKRSWETAPWNK